jgi:hypothetical protein
LKTLLESDEFRAELPGWALRGVLCAFSSAGWAVLMGFQDPAEIAGMGAGVAFWVAVFAAGCAARPGIARWNHPQAVTALKWATWLKIGFTTCGWLLFGLGGMLNLEALSQMGMLGMIDTLLGLASLALVAFIARLKGPETVAAADSFGLTALTTVIEGFLMAGLIAGLALCLWVGWRACVMLGLRWDSPSTPVAG